MLSFLSCDESENNNMVLDTYIDAYVVDHDGNDLLNTNQKNAINLDKLTLVYLVDDKEVLYNESNLDAPHGFILISPKVESDKYSLRIFLNSRYENSVSYLKWDEHNTDTLSVTISKTRSSVICTSVSLNGEQVWDINHNSNKRVISIIK